MRTAVTVGKAARQAAYAAALIANVCNASLASRHKSGRSRPIRTSASWGQMIAGSRGQSGRHAQLRVLSRRGNSDFFRYFFL